MSLIEWNSAYDLGIAEFDEHHKHLVALLNMSYDGFTQGASREELAAVLVELVDYATYHFAAEERWMTENKYPDLLQHSDEHNRFSDRIMEFQRDYYNGTWNLSLEVLQFLCDWLMTHIIKTDAEYGRFAKELLHDAQLTGR